MLGNRARLAKGYVARDDQARRHAPSDLVALRGTSGRDRALAEFLASTFRLGDQPAPRVAEIATNPELGVREISRPDFEAVWNQALEPDDHPVLNHDE